MLLIQRTLDVPDLLGLLQTPPTLLVQLRFEFADPRVTFRQDCMMMLMIMRRRSRLSGMECRGRIHHRVDARPVDGGVATITLRRARGGD